MAEPVPTYADYNVWRDMFPEAEQGQMVRPVRVGMDRLTGKMIVGWPHVEQSMQTLFMTRFHERIFREYCGSFVPHLLGENAVQSIITRFFWALGTAIDLWEPCYKIQRVTMRRQSGEELNASSIVMDQTVSELRRGHARFDLTGIYMPRGHLGDFTPETTRSMAVIGRGANRWDIA